MHIPKKIKEIEISNNNYVKVINKIFLEKDWLERDFLVLSSSNEKNKIWNIVLPITENNEVIYLKEFRVWPEKVVINFPGWALEEWITEIENCKKELEEETWYSSNEFEYLWKSIVENSIEWELRYYLARNCKSIWEQRLEHWENIDVYTTTIDNFEKMILDWEVESSKTAYIFLLARKKWII